MERYKPDIYQKDIFHIDYSSLYQKGIRVLLFDLDNTVGTLAEKKPTQAVMELFSKLKKKFTCFLLSNSLKYRVKPFGEALQIPHLSMAMKPMGWRVKKFLKKNDISLDQVAIIGDQFMTDMALGYRLQVLRIYVDPLTSKDYKITSFNRYREKKIMKRYEQLKLFERGKYYG